jgi:serine/threonine protein phosphatase PrpC
MVAAVGSAQAAAAQVGNANTGPNPPSATFVSAVVTSDAITVGWIGDSRAYWLPESGAGAPMTVDDTLGGQLAAAGVEVSDDAPNLAALVRWIGADATDTAPHIAVFRPGGPGRVIVCSDGLYRYVTDAADLATRVPAGPPIDVARALVEFALESGGQDNVTVIVVPYPPREGS